jgi:glutathione synthase/RimK-type ligase-like ATP-grasp enzyme
LVGGARADPIDTPILLPALAAAGWDAHGESWRDDAVDWSGYDVVLLRSCWDYVEDPDLFLGWVGKVGATTTVVNDPSIVRWNADKSYLAELAADGVPVVDTTLITSADDLVPPSATFVVKPAIGGGSRLVGRYDANDVDAAREHLARLTRGGADAIVQPFIHPERSDASETDVYVIGGRVTHAVTKSQVLVAGAAPAEDFRLAVEQDVRPTTASPEHVRLALDVVAAVQRRWQPPFYARVDLIDTADGPCLLEVEMIEPALFLDRNPEALATFVIELDGHLGDR